jgi:hypothetical protein
MPQQSPRRPRVTDLPPWQTDAPLDKSADLPPGVVGGAQIDFEGMRKKTAKEKNEWVRAELRFLKFRLILESINLG